MEIADAIDRVHHVRLTVTDRTRAHAFYGGVLGFKTVVDTDALLLLAAGNFLIGLSQAPDPARALADDQFDENRVGLDHLSFGVASRDVLDQIAARLDDAGVPRGDVNDLGPDLGLYVLAFRDPDNIQLEFSAPYGA